MQTTTPTGHHYRSTAPDLPGWQPVPPVPVELPDDPLGADDRETWFDHYLTDYDPPLHDAA